MSQRHLQVTLSAVGPVHIGNGEKYGKKDYFKLDDRGIGVLDVRKFVGMLDADGLSDYCEFVGTTDSRVSLQDFLDRHRDLEDAARSCVLYRVDTPLVKARRGSLQYQDVAQFVKDAYGCPYVPGSSVKGMLRTALLAHIIINDKDAYRVMYDRSAVVDREGRKRAGRDMERKALWTEYPDPTDPKVVNDIMRYVSVSDSRPLSTDDLVFVKKYDKFSKGDNASHKLAMGKISKEPRYFEGNEINIYRECLRPGTVIELTVDVDERIDAYLGGLTLDAEGMTSLLESFARLYERDFLDHFDLSGVEGAAGASDGMCRYTFQSGPLKGRRCRNRAVGDTGYCNTHQEYASAESKSVCCYLGGGVDFDTKTVMNAVYEGDPMRVFEISRTLFAQFPTKIDSSIAKNADLMDEVREAGFEPQRMRAVWRGSELKKGKDDHRHWKDAELHVSPHTVKLGILGNKKYLMGRCSIEIKES